MKCDEIRKRIDEAYVPKRRTSLPPDVGLHLRSCDQCRSYCESLRTVEELLIEIPRVSPSPVLLNRLREIGGRDRVASPAPGRKLISWAHGMYLAGGIAAVVLSALPASLPTLLLSFALLVTALTTVSVHLLRRPLLGR